MKARIITLLSLLLVCSGSFSLVAQEKLAKEPGRYQQGKHVTPGGRGRFYMGREIAHVVSGNETAEWLERPKREQEEDTSKMIKLLGLKPGDKAADIGAGSGYISRRLSAAVGPKGTVYAEDIQQEMLDLIEANMKKYNVTNVAAVLGNEKDAKLPKAGLDLIVMVDVYHEFTYPYEMMENLVGSLKPNGRIAFVEFKAEDKDVPIYEAHKMSEAQVKKEALVQDLEWVKTDSTLPWQHVIIFQKKSKK